MKVGKNICLNFLLLAALLADAQDFHFSQFNQHNALINPALTAATEEYRALIGYKSQWRKASGAAYKTFGASFETKVLGGKWKRANELPKKHREQDIGRIGAGLSVYRDKAGFADMGQTQLNLSIATYIPTGHWSFLSVGLQSGIAWRRMDQTLLIYPNQYGPGGYDASIGSGEEVPLERYRYFDVAGGLNWAYGYRTRSFTTTRQTQAKFGVAAYHLTQPKLRVIGRAEENLSMKIVAHGDLLYSLRGTYLALAPSFLFQLQGPSKELVAGTMVKYYQGVDTRFTTSSCLDFGLYYRLGDAIITQLMYEYEGWCTFGFSYDFNVSPLRRANKYQGGMEVIIRITP